MPFIKCFLSSFPKTNYGKFMLCKCSHDLLTKNYIMYCFLGVCNRWYKKSRTKHKMQCDYILQKNTSSLISSSQQAEECSTCLVEMGRCFLKRENWTASRIQQYGSLGKEKKINWMDFSSWKNSVKLFRCSSSF